MHSIIFSLHIVFGCIQTTSQTESERERGRRESKLLSNRNSRAQYDRSTLWLHQTHLWRIRSLFTVLWSRRAHRLHALMLQQIDYRDNQLDLHCFNPFLSFLWLCCLCSVAYTRNHMRTYTTNRDLIETIYANALKECLVRVLDHLMCACDRGRNHEHIQPKEMYAHNGKKEQFFASAPYRSISTHDNGLNRSIDFEKKTLESSTHIAFCTLN